MNTILNIISDNGSAIGSTVYDECAMLDFKIPTSGSWSLQSEDLQKKSYSKIINYQNKRDEYLQSSKLNELLVRENNLTVQTEELIRNGSSPASAEVVELGRKKAKIRSEKRRLISKASRKALDEVFGKGVGEESVSAVYFKDSIAAVDFSELQECNGKWSGEEYSLLSGRPWFVRNLESFKKLIAKGGKIGIEGGPCLFGTDEMRFIFKLRNGSTRVFDFNVMQEIIEGREFSPDSSTELYDFMQSESGNIENASVSCPKEYLTIDEYEQMAFIFLLARGLDAKVIMTIPDLSYNKTFISLFSSLDESIYRPFHESFLAECQRMCLVSIRTIDSLAEKYSVRDYEIFYSGNEARCRIFEEQKNEFIERYRKKNKLTTRSWMEGALQDYICMPAMPFYFYGLTDVIEINRLEEYPSLEKCRSIHSSAFELHELLYPQKLGRNGRISGFYSAFDEKEFIR